MVKRSEVNNAPIDVSREALRMVPVWLASFVASFVIVGLLGIAHMGWSPFWHRLANPIADPGAFDLLAASVAGTYAVAITVYLGGVAALIVTVTERNDRRFKALVDALGNWWLFFPALFWYVATNLIAEGAWGFPRFIWGIPVLIVIGPLAILGFAKVAVRAASYLSAGDGIAVSIPQSDVVTSQAAALASSSKRTLGSPAEGTPHGDKASESVDHGSSGPGASATSANPQVIEIEGPPPGKRGPDPRSSQELASPPENSGTSGDESL